ncbi:cyclin-D1-binding protein 1 homolog isoform 2-T2 [Pholidichthys leucotaenia]
MSTDRGGLNVLVPLRKLLNSTSCIRDRVRDGEPNDSDGSFNLSNFWESLIQAVNAVSQEVTKLSLAFSKPPLPSQQEVEQLCDWILKRVLTLSTIYFWLPKSQGVTLRRRIRDATVDVFEGINQLLEVIQRSPLQSLTQDQLTSTGGFWSSCDRFAQLPRDNKSASVLVLSSQVGVVKDAIEEIQQALSEAQDPFGDVLHDDHDHPLGDQDTEWSDRDRGVVSACVGMLKTAAACLRKMTTAVKGNGDSTSAQNNKQLDDLVDISMDISPGVDDLVLCLYPPMDYSGVENNLSKLASLLKKVLEIIRSTHVCGESEISWVQFLEGAIDHNLNNTKGLIQHC